MNRLIVFWDISPQSEELLDFILELRGSGNYQVVMCVPQCLLPFSLNEVFGGTRPRAEHFNYYEILESILIHTGELSEKGVQRFVSKCRRSQLKVKIHFEENSLEDCVVKESEFSDVVLLDYSAINEIQDKSRIAWLVSNMKSPLVLLPQSESKIENILLIYDGSPSSMRAIKHFGQLMGKTMEGKKFFLISFFDNLQNPEQEFLMMDYIRLHLPNVGYLRLENIHDPGFKMFVENTPNLMVVGGKNQENITSQIFSHSDAFIPQHPVFITAD